ncbi:hypothetical protein [Thermomonas sp. HDW16]|uniref:hypothetical protein n=1 Tax=Thermomonas sp. HDW16 TaxID=2714945 RepID=UPI00140CDBAB|nr:hypothetical protein [Thermomonas sp. HDW16]QIL20712.1 hypothetical protein G7079_08160 [Thermomonas sp. HDW16]
MNRIRILSIALLACTPLFTAQATDKPTGIGSEIRQEMAEARKEVRIDLAKAKRELETENLRVDNSLQFGSNNSKRTTKDLPQAEITPQGDFLIAGKQQAIDAGQRRQLLVYRGRVIEVAKTGIDIGQRSAEAALDAIGNGSLMGLMFGAMTGSLERRVERIVKQEIEPAVRSICRQLPALRASQQSLASSLPQFRPYATLEADDVADCEKDVRNEFALR